MAADVMQAIRRAHMLSLTSEDVTVNLPIWGADVAANRPIDAYSPYGSDAPMIQEMAGAEHWLTPQLSEAMVRFAARCEYARTVEDVLARRNRLLFLDAAAALKVAPQVAALLEMETGVPAQLDAFEKLAVSYLLPLGSL
jgi:glycerol-3-phosphate dehydrogenase